MDYQGQPNPQSPNGQPAPAPQPSLLDIATAQGNIAQQPAPVAPAQPVAPQQPVPQTIPQQPAPQQPIPQAYQQVQPPATPQATTYTPAPTYTDPTQIVDTGIGPTYAAGATQTPAPAAAQQPQQPQQESSPLLDTMRGQGWDVSGFSSDQQLIDTAASGLDGGNAAAAQNAQVAQLLNEVRSQQQPAPAPEPTESPAWQAPEYDQAWLNLVERDDDTGLYVPKQNLALSVPGIGAIAEKVNTYSKWRQSQSDKLISDPVNTLFDAGLGDQIENLIDQRVGERLENDSAVRTAENFVYDNRNELYLIDPTTQQPRVAAGASGQQEPVLSPWGRAISQAHDHLRANGMTDSASRHEIALQLAAPYYGQGQAQGQAPAQPAVNPDLAVGISPNPANMTPNQINDAHRQVFAQPTNPQYPNPTAPSPYQPNVALRPPATMNRNGPSMADFAMPIAQQMGYLMER